MCGQSKAGLTQHECCADPHGYREGVDDNQSHLAVAYPAKQALLQVPARFPRQEHPVGVSIVALHPTLLATRQKVVEPKHIDINDEQDKARPQDQQPEISDCQKLDIWLYDLNRTGMET